MIVGDSTGEAGEATGEAIAAAAAGFAVAAAAILEPFPPRDCSSVLYVKLQLY
jgi:hypothetical protein